MDLQEQRITCLQMAVDMGCKADTVFGLASELMGFVTSGVASSAVRPSPAEEAAHGIAATDTVEPTAAASAPQPLTEACETTQAAMEILSAPEPESPPSLVDAMASAATHTVASASAETEVPGSSSLTVEVAPVDMPTTAPEAGRPTIESQASETAVQSSDTKSQLEMTSADAATVSSAPTAEATQAQSDASAAKTEDASGSAEGSTSAAPAEATVKTNGVGKSDVEIGAPTAT